MRHFSIVPALLLAACGSAATDAPAQPEESVLPQQPVTGPERRILAFGDSLFAGYNVAREESYPAKLEAALRAQGINARVANAGVSGNTSAAGRQRLAFTLDAQEQRPELVVLELGGNDLLRSLPPEQTRENIAAMIEMLQERDIAVLLVGMRAPPNMGPEYVAAFDGLYPELAKQYGVKLVPFFLEPIFDKPELIQADRVHPTAQGIEELVAATRDDVSAALPKKD